jgi:hypothetical protein
VGAVLGGKALPFSWHVFFWEDGTDRASGDASAAVNALVWVNIELVIAFVDALDGANFDAGAVFGSDTGLGNHMSHYLFLLGKRQKALVWIRCIR